MSQNSSPEIWGNILGKTIVFCRDYWRMVALWRLPPLLTRVKHHDPKTNEREAIQVHNNSLSPSAIEQRRHPSLSQRKRRKNEIIALQAFKKEGEAVFIYLDLRGNRGLEKEEEEEKSCPDNYSNSGGIFHPPPPPPFLLRKQKKSLPIFDLEKKSVSGGGGRKRRFRSSYFSTSLFVKPWGPSNWAPLGFGRRRRRQRTRHWLR